MGGDGGCLVTRADCVKTRGYGFTKSSGGRYTNSLGEMANYIQYVGEDRGLGPLERRRLRMQNCWLSQMKLCDPVVACRLGYLYNKEALIGVLLNKSIPAEVGHIRALRDVKHCLITWAEAKTEASTDKRMVCPVSREELDSGGARAVVLWPSGAVISAKTLKELKLKECPLTCKPFDREKDVVPLAPDEEELSRLRESLPVAPTKKRKAAVAASSDIGSAVVEGGTSSSSSGSAGASSSAGVDTATPGPTASSGSASTNAVGGEDGKKAQKVDSMKSDVYNSLFTKDRPFLEGPRDAFGTPVYNRGARVL